MKTKRWKSGSDTPQRNKTELWGKIPVFPIWLTKQKTGPVARKKANDVIPLEFFLCKESGCQEILSFYRIGLVCGMGVYMHTYVQGMDVHVFMCLRQRGAPELTTPVKSSAPQSL